jgi:putative membrane protein
MFIIHFLLRAVFAGLGLWIASRYVHGIVVTSTESLIAAALLLGVVNAIVRPIVFVLTLPFVLVTFGLFLIVINAAMLELVAHLPFSFLSGFHVESFFWAAILGSLVISLVSWVGSWFIHQSKAQSA